MRCIFCLRKDYKETIEHIIPRALGNVHYILPKGAVCSKCNNLFSRYENKVLSSVPFMLQRAKRGQTSETQFKSVIQKETTADIPDLNRFLLKVGFECVFRSKHFLLDRYSMDSLRRFLVEGGEHWPVYPIQSKPKSFQFLPGRMDRFRLWMNGISLRYRDTPKRQLLFYFGYGELKYLINLADHQDLI